MHSAALAACRRSIRAIATFSLPALALAAPLAAKNDALPLFASDDPIDITISGPIRSIARKAENSTDSRPATLATGTESHAIALSARGNARRRPVTCEFPPLLVRFDEKPDDNSLFNGQHRLKLVTHCRSSSRFEQYALREYTAYRLYNVLTPKSLKVRLAHVRYEDDGKVVAERWGFFIEDIDDAAKRLGGKELEVEDADQSQIDRDEAARYMLFQYMIGNLDWDMVHGPKGTDCCHNSKLIGATKDSREALIPIPYDFDYSGLVDAPYAVPPLSIPVTSVRMRYFRGQCGSRDYVMKAIPAFLAARADLEAQVRAVTQLEPRQRDAVLSYLEDFFDDIGSPTSIEKRLFKSCS